ncbi:MAG: hypothetical protein A2008_06900 [Candidatus Wallbacteria bacterium GWC2_49_35]|uniref:Carboxypeptidase regulatory-like domain-containing protein n=1 Tax=Candidatus Wallbacteria bacterium GWC2_49_35 TaxID=1817813 RepID=A0A1F7WM94_9BACT|nr:MAG: hypothetical protein A2008_06900 [Candidatus Wallbacteria bacterium GWC2_49_35]HBC73819.1 hypothetical protein [Candidatus Wallbacteria bacterium]
MISYKNQRLLLVLTLFFSTMFLYGCNGGTSSSGVTESTIKFEIRDITTKAPLDNAIVKVEGPNGDIQIARQVVTDSRGKVTVGDLPPDRAYTLSIAKDGYTTPSNLHLMFVPDIAGGNMQVLVEQGKTYDMIGYLLRSDAPATGTVRGYVKNAATGEPITNAVVSITTGTAEPKVDTTDKPSKPGYYELSNIPSGANNNLQATVPGIATPFAQANLIVPGNGTIDFDIMIMPDVVTINGNFMASPNETLAPGVYVASVLRNGTETISSKQVSITDTTTASKDYTVDNVPVITSGSTSSYTIKITSDAGHMTNPAGGVSGVTIRDKNQHVTIAPITMMSEKGTILVTLYHKPIAITDVTHVSEAVLSIQAPQATLSVEGAVIESMFVNEGPTRFYRYRLNNVPVGQRDIRVNFPGHTVANEKVNAIKDSEVSYLFTLGEGS